MAGAMNEKSDFETLLPMADSPASILRSERSERRRDRLLRAALLSMALVGLLVGINSLVKFHGRACGGSMDSLWDVFDSPMDLEAGSAFGFDSTSAPLCPQVEQLLPEKHKELWKDIGKAFSGGEFKTKAIEWLGGAVRIPTESYDKMDPVGVDPRWEAFGPFHEYLLGAFPLIHSTLKLTKVNTWGLIYEWEGTDFSLKPLLFAAHQDVVPVDPKTVDQWQHPPYSGFFDGERIWGRGSSDDKSGLVGVMSAVETLLAAKFQPARKVVLAFGFDEETSGIYGAQELGKYMDATFGEDAFAMLVDEGGGFSTQYGGVFAVPAVGEKGYLDVRVEVSSPGGHSSIPPAHTSIGMLSSLLVQYESHPVAPELDRTTPIYGTMQCLAAHAPDMPAKLRKTIKKSVSSNKALRKLEGILSEDPTLKSYIGTTQAIDLIQGGVKANALPEQAWAVVDHRIATQSSVETVKAHNTKLLQHLASKFNLSYNAFGEDVTSGSGAKYGSLVITDAWGTALEPAPITPTGKDAAPYKLLSGTIKATYNSHRNFENKEEIKVAPGIMTGNTDTRYYWKLTKHIFRYNHHNAVNSGSLGGVHTVNESIDVDGFLEMIRFFTTLILNADESTVI